MNEPNQCKVCGLPLDAHQVGFRGGVAHAVARDRETNHILSWCSETDRDRSYTVGQIATLRTIVRSLRYMAGRARTKGDESRAAALADYSFKVETDRDRLIGNLARWYSWKEWNEP